MAEHSQIAQRPEQRVQRQFAKVILGTAGISTAIMMGSDVSSILTLATFLALQFQYDPPASIKMGEIQLRLFYKGSGRLSDDVLSGKEEFVFHNTIIGEGDAIEAADDVLISVEMSAGKFGTPEDNEKSTNSPVEIVARDATGKVLGRRTFRGVLTSNQGTESKVLWLNDVTCAGDVRITASYAGTTKSAKVVMGCGE